MEETSKEIILNANEHARMGYYNSLYSSQYLLAKQNYESQRKKWVVTSTSANHFTLVDSNDVATDVYFSWYIKNCSCDDFVNSETGRCQHLYALENNIREFRDSLEKDENMIWVDYPNAYLYKKALRKPVRLENLDLNTIKSENPDCKLTPSVEKFTKRQIRLSRIKEVVELGDFELFSPYKITLYKHQKESIREMLENKRTILTLKMGLGKTICALYCCAKLADKQKIIIVCPNSLKFQWKKEIDRFNLGSSLVISKGIDLELYKNQKFLILSYEMLNRHNHILKDDFDIAVLDEIQKIKNGESKTWETIKDLKSEFIFSLSGTPIQNNITDLISILKVISPQEFCPDWRFYETYCMLSRTRITGWNRINLPQLKEKLKRYLINPAIDWRDFKLPTKTVHTVECSLDDIQKANHNYALEQAKILLSKAYHYPLSFKEKAVLNGLLLKCRRSVSDGRLISDKAIKSSRFEKIENLLVEKVKAGNKVVVYSDWIDCLKLLMPRLEEENIKYVIFTGEITDKAKSRNLESFTSDAEVKVFLSTDSGGLGVDGLQLASNTIIHVEDIWNPAKLAQRDGRLIRALQSADNVDVYHFNSGSGIEELLKQNKVGKQQIVSDVMN